MGSYGHIDILSSNGKVLDTIDLSANPQTRLVGGANANYFPVIINGATANIYSHQTLPANEAFTVTVDPWVFLDADGAPFAGVTDSSLWRFDTQVPRPINASYLTVAADGSGRFLHRAGGNRHSARQQHPAHHHYGATGHLYGNGTRALEQTVHYLTRRRSRRYRIQYADNNNLNPNNARALMSVDASDFILQDITVWNTTPRGGLQAGAFRGNNKRILLNRVTLKSYQDTLWLQGTGAVLNSYIEGDVDFVWGYGSVYFKNTELKALTSGGFYTQIRNDIGVPGNVFVDCKLTAADGVTGMYLGRIDPTAFPYSQVAYINSQMDSHIAPAGWLLNNATSAANVAFWEYKSTDASGALLDVSQRPVFSRQISADEARQWSDLAVVLGGWVPAIVNALLGTHGTLRVDWTAPQAGTRFVGLYRRGAPDTEWIGRQTLGNPHSGQVVFGPLAEGDYEVRLATGTGTVTKRLY